MPKTANPLNQPEPIETKMNYLTYGRATEPIRRYRLISVLLLSFFMTTLVLTLSAQFSDSAAVGKYRQGRDRGK